MTEQDILTWWWGRVLPKTHQHLTGLSNLNEAQLAVLTSLKNIWEEAQETETPLEWGYQFRMKDIKVTS